MVRDARVFALVRNSGELEVPEVSGDDEGKEWAGLDDWDASDP